MSFPELEKNRTLGVTCPNCGTQFTTLATQVVLPGYPTFRALQEGKLNLACYLKVTAGLEAPHYLSWDE